MIETRRLRAIAFAQAMAWAILMASSCLMARTSIEGLFLGGLVMALNLQAMRALASFFTSRRYVGAVAIFSLLKTLLVLLGTGAVMHICRPEPLAFVLGLSTFLMGVAFAILQVQMGWSS